VETIFSCHSTSNINLVVLFIKWCFFFFFLSSRNIIRKQKSQSMYTRSTRETLSRREKKKTTRIMKSNQIRKGKCNCPKAKSFEEEKLKLHHRPLIVLKAFIIFFPFKDTTKGMETLSSTQVLHFEGYHIIPLNK
jgi:hypothetical protein